MTIIYPVPGANVSWLGSNYQVKKILNLEDIWAVHLGTGRCEVIKVAQIEAEIKTEAAPESTQDIATVPAEIIEKGKKIYDEIEPLIKGGTRGDLLRQCTESNVSESTMRRRIEKWNKFGNVAALVPGKSNGGKGKTRLKNTMLLAIIDQFVTIYFSTKEYINARKLYKAFENKCKTVGIKPCSENTLRERIKANSTYCKERKIYIQNVPGPSKSGKFLDGNYPLDVVQIDHTQVDVILVDQAERKPLFRPWVTLAIDVFSE